MISEELEAKLSRHAARMVDSFRLCFGEGSEGNSFERNVTFGGVRLRCRLYRSDAALTVHYAVVAPNGASKEFDFPIVEA